MIRVIAGAVFVLVLAVAMPAHADGWTGWKTFASHNGVVLEWRTYSHREHDTKADWRVTNNTTEGLYFLFLGTRIYTCSNGSDAFPHLRSSFGDLELSPGASVTFSDGGVANYVGADHIDRASCPSIAEAAFDKGTSWALEFAVRNPHGPVKPWMEHTLAARESRESRGSVATCEEMSPDGSCAELAYESESAPISFRNDCESRVRGKYVPDGSCLKKGARLCTDISWSLSAVASLHVYDVDRFLDMYWSNEIRRGSAINEEEYMRIVCEENYYGTYMGLQ